MKCFIAFSILALIGLPALGGIIYLLFTVPHLATAFGAATMGGAVILALLWVIGTAGECLSERK